MLMSLSPFCCGHAEAKDFVVVIDAGHGGHDPGAVGKSAKEKHINLSVALKVGKLIQKNCPDVKVIYTRTKDVFVPLNRRAEIANEAKADLFISIHTNALANNRTAKGASTWTLGLAKSEANLEMAKRENSVILYEDDYKTRYAGFNPNSSESYIIFEFMQDKYMSQSVHLAALVQNQFSQTCKRQDRGVHQAGFLVLKASAMPSVLIELGFISTPEEERFLSSENGASTMAEGIYRAFLAYKQEQEIRQGGTQPATVTAAASAAPVQQSATQQPVAQQPATQQPATQPAPSQPARQETVPAEQAASVAAQPVNVPAEPVRPATAAGEIVFKVQIMASEFLLKPGDRRLQGLEGVEYYREGGLYKYTYGSSTDYNRMLRVKREVSARFKDAFVVAFKDGKKMNIQAAISEFKRNGK